MVNCSYCNKELNRLVFCTSSHKVMFHRNPNHKPKLIIVNQEAVKKSSPIIKEVGLPRGEVDSSNYI